MGGGKRRRLTVYASRRCRCPFGLRHKIELDKILSPHLLCILSESSGDLG